jgi:hypothetical protein
MAITYRQYDAPQHKNPLMRICANDMDGNWIRSKKSIGTDFMQLRGLMADLKSNS